jgi:ATP-dependent Lon protease
MDETTWRAEEGAARKAGERMPLLPVRDGAIFPYIITPLTVSRARAIAAIETALADESRMVFIVSQRERTKEEPSACDLYETGTIAVIMRMLKFPDGRVKVLLQGLCRAKLVAVEQEHPHMTARVDVVQEP